MKQRQYLVPRGNSWYVRVMIPKDVRSFYGTQKEIMKALGTTDEREAEVRKHAVLHEILNEFQTHRQRRTPAADDMTRAAEEVYRLALEDDQHARDTALNESAYEAERHRLYRELPDGKELEEALADLQARRWSPEKRARWRDGWELALREHIAAGETVLVADLAAYIIEREGYVLAKDSIPYRQFCRELTKGQLRAIEKMKDRDRGNFEDDEPTRAKVAAPTPASVPDSPTIADRIALYVTENPRRAKKGTLEQIRFVASLFEEFVGPPARVSQITRQTVAEWKRALRSWPDRAPQRKQFAGLTFREIITKNETTKVKTIGEKTINRYLSDLAAFCKWLWSENLLPENPLSGQFLIIDKSEKPRESFTTDQLQTLFTSPLYTGCKTSKLDHKPGTVKVRDHRFWLPLISLWTGARITEIAQLSVSDLMQKDGVWAFDITTESDDDLEKSLKTKNSKRLVPVHRALVDLGLIEYWQATKKGGHQRLFADIVPDRRGSVGANPSRWFGRYLNRIGIKTKKTVFHSFRHSFTDALRRAGYLDAQFAPLTGHASTMYGVEQPLTLKQRAKLIEAVKYDLDLSHLVPDDAAAEAA